MLYNIALCSEMPVADENGQEEEDEEEEDVEADVSLRARDGRHMRGVEEFCWIFLLTSFWCFGHKIKRQTSVF